MNAEKAIYISSQEWVRSLQRKLYGAAKNSSGRRFGLLFDKVCGYDILQEAWRRVARNAGSSGVDGVTIEQIKEEGAVEFLLEIQKELRAGTYNPLPVLRCYIQKGWNSKRPLGIPIVKDRVVQMAVKLVIEPLFEADFCECSYGFRPQRSNTEAAELVHRRTNRHKWVVDLDLKSYFDTINHELLMEFVRRRVTDKRVLHLIRRWLKAGVMENGLVSPTKVGAPQGGVISPLLSNIFLNEFDRRWNDDNGKLVRFADDMVILCDSPQQAEQALKVARHMLEQMHLMLNRAKTSLVHVREGFDFLGFTYKEAYSRERRRHVRIKFPRAKSMKKARAGIKERVKKIPLGEPLMEAIAVLNRKLRGWANYFRIGNSYEAARELTSYACQQLRLFLRRRRARKDIVGYRRWPNSFFYEKGLEYGPHLL
ncbi:MAG: group II intron reverse transcriptase/maturase [Candidatus Brocadiia bacterium]